MLEIKSNLNSIKVNKKQSLELELILNKSIYGKEWRKIR